MSYDSPEERREKIMMDTIKSKDAEITSLKEENERLVKWVDDLLCILRTLLWATGQGSVSVGEKRNKINAPH